LLDIVRQKGYRSKVKNDRISVRLPAATKQFLKRAAAADQRSLSATVEIILNQWVRGKIAHANRVPENPRPGPRE